MMQINYILRKSYKFAKLQENINHPMHMKDMKLFAQKEKEIETLIQIIRIYSCWILTWRLFLHAM